MFFLCTFKNKTWVAVNLFFTAYVDVYTYKLRIKEFFK